MSYPARAEGLVNIVKCKNSPISHVPTTIFHTYTHTHTHKLFQKEN